MKRFGLIGCCLLFFSGSAVLAQEESGTSGNIIFSEETDTARRVDYNALSYFQMERYRPDHSKFSDKSFFDNMSVGLYGGYAGLVNRGAVNVDADLSIGVSLSKFFNPVSGLRLSATYMRPYSNMHRDNLGIFNFSADYLLDLTSFVTDFEPGSIFRLISAQGIGVNRSSSAGLTDLAYDVHWGLKFRFETKTRLDFFVEPRLMLYTDQIDLSQNRNWRKYDLGYGVFAGVDYSLGNSYREYLPESKYYGWNGVFLGFTGGVQRQVAEVGGNVGFMNSLGPSLAVSVGKWFRPVVGIRTSLFASGNSWASLENSNFVRQAVYGGARLEGLLDLMAFSGSGRGRFSLVPSAGLELGMTFKQAADYTRTNYLGATAALQFKYWAEPDLALFIEPRFSYVPFGYDENGGVRGDNDKIIALNFGVETMNLGRGFSESNILSRKRDEFTPHFTFSAGIGGAVVVQQSHYFDRTMTHMANIGLGYWFNSVSGLRADGNMGSLISRMPSSLSQINVSASLNYTLNVLNLVAGYDSSRNWDAEIFLGPMLGVVSQNATTDKLHFGVQGGGRLSYRLPYGFDFYLEPRMHVYTRRLFPVGSGTPAIAAMNFGGTYHFAYKGGNRGNVERFGKSFVDNTFVGFTAGPMNSLANIKNSLWSATGTEYSFYLGKWMTPYIGLRGSVYADYYSYLAYNDESRLDRTQAFAGAGLELMFNPFRIADPDTYYMFELVPMAGIRTGLFFKQSASSGSVAKGAYTSFTAAMQLRYNAARNMALVVEPRWTRTPFNTTYSAGKRAVSRENHLSLNVGVELTHSMSDRFVKVAQSRQGYMPYWFASVSGGIATRVTAARYGTANVGYSVDLSAGHSFTPLSSVRLGYSYVSIPSIMRGGNDLSMNNISLDYMFEVSNLVAGYDPDRRVGLQLFAGPVLSVQEGNGSQTRFGLEMGGLGYAMLTDNLMFTLQPKGLAFPLTGGDKPKSRQLMFNLNAGLTYRF